MNLVKNATGTGCSLRVNADCSLLAHTLYTGPTNLARGKVPVEADNALAGPADHLWGSNNLVDGERISQPDKKEGFSTQEYDHKHDISGGPQKITIDLGAQHEVGRVFLYPRTSSAGTEKGAYPNYPQDSPLR